MSVMVPRKPAEDLRLAPPLQSHGQRPAQPSSAVLLFVKFGATAELVAGAGAWSLGDLLLDLEPTDSGVAEKGLLEPARLVMAPVC